jgi:predicted RNA polymerase sigma factor
MFTACHPRVALTLRVAGGLTSDEIARAFLVPAATVQARITRAKKTLLAAHVPVAVSPASERVRAASSARAGRLVPDEPEVHGLLARSSFRASARSRRCPRSSGQPPSARAACSIAPGPLLVTGCVWAVTGF